MKLDPIITQALIKTPEFDLRPVRDSDAGLIEMYASDVRVARNIATIPHPLPPGSIDTFITRAGAEDRQEDYWVMDATRLGGSEVMGLIWLERMGRDQSGAGFWVAPAFWNFGVASAALAALLEANPQSSRTFFASVFQDNPASARVLTNLGFQYLGDAEAFCVARNANVATWTYSRSV